MMPFKPLFFYNLSDSVELVIVIDKYGNIEQKVCSTKIIPSVFLDKLERIFEED